MVNGCAQLNLQDVRGKAQTASRALHVFPGKRLLRPYVAAAWVVISGVSIPTRLKCACCRDSDTRFSLCCAGSMLSRLVGYSWPTFRLVE